jgi:signal transduction histidine kinase
LKSKLPSLIASLLLAAALIAAVGGTRLAYQPMELRHPSDRQVLRTLAETWQQEMNRLEEVLGRDLEELLEGADVNRDFTLREAQGSLHGVAEVTQLRDSTARPQRVRSITNYKPPPPEVSWQSSSTNASWGQLDPKLLLDYDFKLANTERPIFLRQEQGWLRSSKEPWAFYWCRMLEREDRAFARVATVHVPTLQRVLEDHLRSWLPAHFGPVAVLRGLDFAEGPQQSLLAGTSERPVARQPDFLAPISSPWGNWQMVSWDRLETKPGWNDAVLLATGLISGLLGITALMVFTHLRRALRLAEERVTFVNRVSHDLGTPLTNMMLNLDLAEETLEEDPEHAAARLAIVREEGLRLGRLVENVLVFSRSGKAEHPLRPVNCQPKEVLQRVLQQFEPALKRRLVKSQIHGNADCAHLDPDALAQILANLLSNVEKYAAWGGELTITMETKFPHLEITVQDAGPGIPEADRERIFAPFCRLHSGVNEGASGTGLGLAIARDLARQMGGDLACIPCPTPGACFRLRLPITPLPSPQLAPLTV